MDIKRGPWTIRKIWEAGDVWKGWIYLTKKKTNEEVLGAVRKNRMFVDAIETKLCKTIERTQRHHKELHNVIIESIMDRKRCARRPRNCYVGQIENVGRVQIFKDRKTLLASFPRRTHLDDLPDFLFFRLGQLLRRRLVLHVFVDHVPATSAQRRFRSAGVQRTVRLQQDVIFADKSSKRLKNTHLRVGGPRV